MASIPQTVAPKVELIDSDGEPLETPWHFAAIALLIDTTRYHLQPRTDFFVGGNMFIYYSQEQARNLDYRGPDFFFVDRVDGERKRRWWAIWEEGGRFPDLIIELLSPTTAKTDRTVKKRLYEGTFRTPEYFCYEPETHTLEGWRLGSAGRYQKIKPDKRGWFRSEIMQLSLGNWTGIYLGVHDTFPRWYNQEGDLVPTFVEAARLQADTERQRADAERQRAERAERELARLKASGKRTDQS